VRFALLEQAAVAAATATNSAKPWKGAVYSTTSVFILKLLVQ
jgi:hypothetical protein